LCSSAANRRVKWAIKAMASFTTVIIPRILCLFLALEQRGGGMTTSASVQPVRRGFIHKADNQ
jgi:hypothetical protein